MIERQEVRCLVAVIACQWGRLIVGRLELVEISQIQFRVSSHFAVTSFPKQMDASTGPFRPAQESMIAA